jgi:hypothetical protein
MKVALVLLMLASHEPATGAAVAAMAAGATVAAAAGASCPAATSADAGGVAPSSTASIEGWVKLAIRQSRSRRARMHKLRRHAFGQQRTQIQRLAAAH